MVPPMSRRTTKACRPASGPPSISTSRAQVSRLAPPVSCRAALMRTGTCTFSARNASKRGRKSFMVVIGERARIGGQELPLTIVQETRMDATQKWRPTVRRRIYLLRHGDVSYFDEQGKPFRPTTVPLNPEGRLQAEAVGHVLAEVPL